MSKASFTMKGRRCRSAASTATTGVLSILCTALLVLVLQLPGPVSCFVVAGSNSDIIINNMRNRLSSPTIPGSPPLPSSTTSGSAFGISSSKKSSSTHRRPQVPVVAAGGGGGGAAALSAAHNAVVFDNAPNLRFQLIVLTANALGYVISLLFRGLHLHVDLLGTGAFALGALPALLLNNSPAAKTRSSAAAAAATRIQWSSIAVIAWSVRLAGFLFYRIISSSTRHDARLDAILMDPVYAAGFWIYSALWGISCALPYSLGLTSSSGAGHPVALYSGMTLFGIGWLVECLADYQKYIFKRSNSSGAAFCNVGMWSISQHPNWFGNLLLWAGIFVMNAPALVDPSSGTSAAGRGIASSLWRRIWSYRRVALALIGPAFMLNLFYSQATGKLMADVFAANRAKYGYGTNAAFTDYIDS
jgi:steroid 5-alpha reductase family enzyme